MHKVMIFILLILATIVLATGAYFIFQGKTLTIEIEKAEIQRAINRRMPYEKAFAFIFNLRLASTEMFLEAGSDRIGVGTVVQLNINLGKSTQNLGGYIKANAGLKYNPENFSFYLQNPAVESVRIEGIPEKYTQKVSETLREIMQKIFAEIPVYQVQVDELKMKLAKSVLKDLRIENGKVIVVLGYGNGKEKKPFHVSLSHPRHDLI